MNESSHYNKSSFVIYFRFAHILTEAKNQMKCNVLKAFNKSFNFIMTWIKMKIALLQDLKPKLSHFENASKQMRKKKIKFAFNSMSKKLDYKERVFRTKPDLALRSVFKWLSALNIRSIKNILNWRQVYIKYKTGFEILTVFLNEC